MTSFFSLPRMLFRSLTITSRDPLVERALQERQAAASALENIGAHTLCLEAALETIQGADAASNATIKELKALVDDIKTNLMACDLELEAALDEIS